jgi:hypothetical protein
MWWYKSGKPPADIKKAFDYRQDCYNCALQVFDKLFQSSAESSSDLNARQQSFELERVV